MDESLSDTDDNDALNATAIEREMALAEAAEKENEKKKIAQLKQLFPDATGQELSGLSATKRKLGLWEPPEKTSPRKSIRPRTKQDEALETLKSIREANKREEQLRKEGLLPLPVPTRRSPVLSRYEMEEHKAPSPPPDLPGSFQEFQRVRVSRSNFGKVCFYPGFAEAITGCFARVVFNQDPVTGENMYRMVRIAGMFSLIISACLTLSGFTQGKPYMFEDHDNRAHMTDQYIKSAYGATEKEYPFAMCSDAKFTEVRVPQFRSQH
jgi:RNA polymerase-associated protein RTF1